MYILMKTDNPEKLKISYNFGQKQFCFDNPHFIYTQTLSEAKNSLDNLCNIEDYEYWEKRYPKINEKLYEECKKYLLQLILETNTLSNKEIKDLCDEYISFFPSTPAEPPKIKYMYPFSFRHPFYVSPHPYTELIHESDIYCIETGKNRNVKFYFHGNLSDAHIPFYPFNGGVGVLQTNIHELIYFIDYLRMPVSEHLKGFWEFCKKSLNVYSITYNQNENEITVIKKPQQLYFQDGISHLKYDKNHCFCDGVNVPEFVFNTNKENAEINRLKEIKNVDIRSIFIKKAGIEKFIKKGKVIDTWENYPDNEWWAKSEYQLIDLVQVFGGYGTRYKGAWYNQKLYLCMKNQTTGEYHMEGVTPDCINLYDALKMRYQILDLPSYEIKNIK